ncbi:MAG: hypothetical protein DYH08_09380 [Actinobacteria bacterium ATB1]|nr:hypothetical protein [Actinobacteria bacterium ATB1]
MGREKTTMKINAVAWKGCTTGIGASWNATKVSIAVKSWEDAPASHIGLRIKDAMMRAPSPSVLRAS